MCICFACLGIVSALSLFLTLLPSLSLPSATFPFQFDVAYRHFCPRIQISFGKTVSCPFCAHCNCCPSLWPHEATLSFSSLFLSVSLSLSLPIHNPVTVTVLQRHPLKCIHMRSQCSHCMTVYGTLSLFLSLSPSLSLSAWQDTHFWALCVHLNEAGAANGPTDTRTALQAPSQLSLLSSSPSLPLTFSSSLSLTLTWLVINSTLACAY